MQILIVEDGRLAGGAKCRGPSRRRHGEQPRRDGDERRNPAVSAYLTAIARLIADCVGPASADRKLAEIEAVIADLQETPHKGSLCPEIAPDLRAIPAGRKGACRLYR